MEEKTGKAGAILRIVGVIAIIAVIIAAIVASMNHKTPVAEKVWYPEMTLGDMETAENHFIIYSDIACPYCIAFEAAMVEHHDELMQYIEQNKVLIEVRATDFLYEFGESNPIESRYSAVATYCAKREGKFWNFYDKAVSTVWNDWFKGMGKAAFTDFNKLGKGYWIKMGKDVGLSDEFASCVENDETLPEVMADARKMAKFVNGLPYFKFNEYVSSGFDLSWGWEYVLMYFDAGMKSK
ncbi:thioredoxin domain-containing protein [Candidatus Saccharibacteria bacterium]|nr:thioredoxin domain-containing protein [Candidatus Saccharibacteria bacterium]